MYIYINIVFFTKKNLLAQKLLFDLGTYNGKQIKYYVHYVNILVCFFF